MSEKTYKVPPFAARVLSALPRAPGSALFATALNLSVLEHLPDDTLAVLEGKAFRLQARDAGLAVDVVLQSGRFRAAPASGDIALILSADMYDYYRMARRREDPDTLFFSRRLTMEGDTELGLWVKNALDAMDMSALDPLRILHKRLPF